MLESVLEVGYLLLSFAIQACIPSGYMKQYMPLRRNVERPGGSSIRRKGVKNTCYLYILWRIRKVCICTGSMLYMAWRAVRGLLFFITNTPAVTFIVIVFMFCFMPWCELVDYINTSMSRVQLFLRIRRWLLVLVRLFSIVRFYFLPVDIWYEEPAQNLCEGISHVIWP